ncbi:MAG: glycosyltransferase [Candidatus Didemnitutus sp.]|nr:glycosyltransferase [Candidatus Didemnitutus sp.]
MKIAFVSTILGYPWGGADTLWTNAAEAAQRRGDELLISVSPVVAASPRVAALVDAGARLHERVPASVPNSLGARVAGKIRRTLGRAGDGLVDELAAFRPDLVIISLGGTYDLILHHDWVDWFAANQTRVRLIANWQAENPSLTEPEWHAAKRALTLAEQVCFVSTRNLTVTRRHLLDPLPRARVIQNPLRWQPVDVSPWPDSPLAQLATVSRLDEGKGIHLVLHALAAMAPRPDFRLNIYGQGPAEAYLRATAEHLGLTASVHFRGYVKNLRDIWAANHLLVSASVDDGVPMTIPEAMLCERPVLSTEVGGANDWITDGVNGYLCPAPTVPLLAATLQRALLSPSRASWPALGRAAATAAHARYLPQDHLTLLV